MDKKIKLFFMIIIFILFFSGGQTTMPLIESTKFSYKLLSDCTYELTGIEVCGDLI